MTELANVKPQTMFVTNFHQRINNFTECDEGIDMNGSRFAEAVASNGSCFFMGSRDEAIAITDVFDPFLFRCASRLLCSNNSPSIH